MKRNTSITLSAELLMEADLFVKESGLTRSQLIENAVRDFLDREKKAARDRRDRALLERRASEFEGVMEDVLDYQTSD